MQETDREPLATIALIAAFADGFRSPEEVAALRRIAAEIGGTDFETIARQIVGDDARLDRVISHLSDDEARHKAYELAVAVVYADGAANEKERAFLDQLRPRLGLADADSAAMEAAAAVLGRAGTSIELAPEILVVTSDSPPARLDELVLKNAILAGALELLPQGLATLAIVPLQLRMVYRIGKDFGQDLGVDQVKDLAATLGIGAAGQVMEGMARRLLGGLARGVFGRTIGGAAGEAAGAASGAAMTFATTYALGQVARRYYGQGRQLGAGDLKLLFARLRDEARVMFPRLEGEIRRQAEKIDVADVVRRVG